MRCAATRVCAISVGCRRLKSSSWPVLPQQGGDLGLRQGDRLRRNRRAQDVIEPRDPFELFLNHGVGQQDHIILVLPNRRLPFDRQHAQHPARDLLHTDGLAHRIGGAKQIGDDGLAEHTDPADGCDVVLCKEGPMGQAPAADRHEGGGDPAHLGGPILVAEDDLDPQVNVRGEVC